MATGILSFGGLSALGDSVMAGSVSVTAAALGAAAMLEPSAPSEAVRVSIRAIRIGAARIILQVTRYRWNFRPENGELVHLTFSNTMRNKSRSAPKKAVAQLVA